MNADSWIPHIQVQGEGQRKHDPFDGQCRAVHKAILPHMGNARSLLFLLDLFFSSVLALPSVFLLSFKVVTLNLANKIKSLG